MAAVGRGLPTTVTCIAATRSVEGFSFPRRAWERDEKMKKARFLFRNRALFFRHSTGRVAYATSQPARYFLLMYLSATATLVAFRFWASHSSFCPVRKATLPSNTDSVNAPE